MKWKKENNIPKLTGPDRSKPENDSERPREMTSSLLGDVEDGTSCSPWNSDTDDVVYDIIIKLLTSADMLDVRSRGCV